MRRGNMAGRFPASEATLAAYDMRSYGRGLLPRLMDLSGNGYDALASTTEDMARDSLSGENALDFEISNDAAYNVPTLGDALIGVPYVALFVCRPFMTSVGNNYLCGGSAGVTDGNLHIGYADGTTVRVAQWNNDLSATVTYEQNRRDVFVVSHNNDERAIYFNDPTTPAASDTSGFVSSNDGWALFNRTAGTASGIEGNVFYVQFWRGAFGRGFCADVMRLAQAIWE